MTCLFRIMLFTIVTFFFFFQQPSFAESDYILPYPSLMPGHRFYKILEIIDWIRGAWSFGSFAQFTNRLSLADRKLVEAKTLFEYKQYLLATDAISFYKRHLCKAADALKRAKREGKNITEKKKLFVAATLTHKQVLERTKEEHPPEVVWKPERGEHKIIAIGQVIERAIMKGKECKEE